MPDVLVEKLSFSRTISGREWQVKAEGAEREAGMIRARLVEIKVAGSGNSGDSTLRAGSGEFSETSSNARMRDVSGVISYEGKSVDFAAPSAEYNGSDDMWFFSDGVRLSDGSALLTGRMAKINADGVFTIGKGARASWEIK